MTDLVVIAREELERIVEEAAARAVQRALRTAQTEREPVDLVGVAEIAEMLGVSRQTAYRIVDQPGFPGGIQAGTGSYRQRRVWKRGEVIRWLERQKN